jgi:hypothetical protein
MHRLLVVRSSDALFAADTPSNFRVAIPAHVFPEGPFGLRLELGYFMMNQGYDTPYSVEVHTSLGSKQLYDTRSSGASQFVGMLGALSNLGHSPSISCTSPGSLSSVTFRLVDSGGNDLAQTNSTVLVFSVKKM